MTLLVVLFVWNKLLDRLHPVPWHAQRRSGYSRSKLPVVIQCRHKRLLWCLDLRHIFSQSQMEMPFFFLWTCHLLEEFNTMLTFFLSFRILSDVLFSAKPFQRPQSELVATSRPSAPSPPPELTPHSWACLVMGLGLPRWITSSLSHLDGANTQFRDSSAAPEGTDLSGHVSPVGCGRFCSRCPSLHWPWAEGFGEGSLK